MKYCVDPHTLSNVMDYAEKYIHQPNQNNHTPLIVACKQGNLEAVKFLLKKFVEDLDLFFSEKDENGDFPLHIAVRMGYFRLVELLLEYYHPTDKKNNAGQKPADLCRHDTQTWTILSRHKGITNK